MLGLKSVLYQAVDMFFYILYLLIFVRIIISWLPIGRDNSLVSLIYTFTDPILGPIRSMIEKSPLGGGMMLDFSPIIALFVMNIVKMIVLAIIVSIF